MAIKLATRCQCTLKKNIVIVAKFIVSIAQRLKLAELSNQARFRTKEDTDYYLLTRRFAV